MGLMDISALRHIWAFSRAEFFVALASLLGVLGSGPVNGVLLGAAISIALLLRQAARPRVTELTRVPGTTYFADRSRHPDDKRIDGVLVVRCESALVYFNSEYVRERLNEIVRGRRDEVRLIVFFLGPVQSCWPIFTGHFALAESNFGLPSRTAPYAMRFSASASNENTVHSKRARRSTTSSRSGTPHLRSPHKNPWRRRSSGMTEAPHDPSTCRLRRSRSNSMSSGRQDRWARSGTARA
jgi:hypothetical protein